MSKVSKVWVLYFPVNGKSMDKEKAENIQENIPWCQDPQFNDTEHNDTQHNNEIR
jgi:hypothetical protein